MTQGWKKLDSDHNAGLSAGASVIVVKSPDSGLRFKTYLGMGSEELGKHSLKP